MRWAEKKRKKILLPNSVRTRPRLENSQKNDKKILLPNAVRTRPGQENSERNSKKFEKILKTTFQHYF